MSNQPLVGSTEKRINGLTIITKNLSKRFNREWIFKDLSYTFTAGNKYAIIGPNGSGKSTLLQILWGQVPQTSGSLIYEKLSSEISPEAIYAHISIATPYMDLIDEFTLQEQIEFHFKLKKKRGLLTTEELINILYLEESGNKHIGDFSSGMKQRLKLGLAFYTDSEAIFLDEPTTNLDKKAFEWYEKQLQALPSTSLIFIASNNPLEYPSGAKIVDLLDYKS